MSNRRADPSLWDINPHAALLQDECYESDEDRRWEKFCADVARLLNLPHLDGDQATDGYSLDSAQGMFEGGCTAKECAIELRLDMRNHPTT